MSLFVLKLQNKLCDVLKYDFYMILTRLQHKTSCEANNIILKWRNVCYFVCKLYLILGYEILFSNSNSIIIL